METTDKFAARALSRLLVAHGVTDVVLSPGSRNAPLIVAIARNASLNTHVVIDERCAAFIALGIASATRRPVAVVCTSGTALLNYAPAVAEAFYRNLPLIVVSADRPSRWIGQNDSQTMVQPGALATIVKRTYDIPDTPPFSHALASRYINDAIATAQLAPAGPVHVNIQLDEPLNLTVEPTDDDGTMRPIELHVPHEAMELGALPPVSAADRVLIVAGIDDGIPPAETLSRLCAAHGNVAVLAEPLSGLTGDYMVGNVDTTVEWVDGNAAAESLMPDIVVTMGGAIVSKRLKRYLRALPASVAHWHVGHTRETIDCYGHIAARVEASPEAVLNGIAASIDATAASASSCNYRRLWLEASVRARRDNELRSSFAEGFTARLALASLVASLPDGCNLEVSNGMSVRIVQELPLPRLARLGCNRGVSGIDGSVSTAVGVDLASRAHGIPTVLITGDMSLAYDIGALACIASLGSTIKIAVVNNGGGGIFRAIDSTRRLPELERYFVAPPVLPLRQLAAAYGIEYFEASSPSGLQANIPLWLGVGHKAAILELNIQ